MELQKHRASVVIDPHEHRLHPASNVGHHPKTGVPMAIAAIHGGDGGGGVTETTPTRNALAVGIGGGGNASALKQMQKGFSRGKRMAMGKSGSTSKADAPTTTTYVNGEPQIQVLQETDTENTVSELSGLNEAEEAGLDEAVQNLF